jgi:hypothetical protein
MRVLSAPKVEAAGIAPASHLTQHLTAHAVTKCDIVVVFLFLILIGKQNLVVHGEQHD